MLDPGRAEQKCRRLRPWPQAQRVASASPERAPRRCNLEAGLIMFLPRRLRGIHPYDYHLNLRLHGKFAQDGLGRSLPDSQTGGLFCQGNATRQHREVSRPTCLGVHDGCCGVGSPHAVFSHSAPVECLPLLVQQSLTQGCCIFGCRHASSREARHSEGNRKAAKQSKATTLHSCILHHGWLLAASTAHQIQPWTLFTFFASSCISLVGLARGRLRRRTNRRPPS